jgi:hypothetical protein
MSARSEYETAKRKYHHAGKAARGSRQGSEARKLYEQAKRSYHTLGKKLAKKGR